MEIAKLQLNMYVLFDRIGEQVMFDYEVHFDFDDVVKNRFTKSNFIVVTTGFNRKDLAYLSSFHANVEAWASEAQAYITADDNETAIEAFGEWLTDHADEARNAAFDKLF